MCFVMATFLCFLFIDILLLGEFSDLIQKEDRDVFISI